MKKLLSSILAVTMVAGMSVTTLAKQKAVKGPIAGLGINSEDYTFYTHFYNNGRNNNNINPTDKIYLPILISEKELDEDVNNDGLKDDYAFATQSSQIEDLEAEVTATIADEYMVQDANIVKVGSDKLEKYFNRYGDVYCVELQVADYYQDGDKELEFDIQLINDGYEEANTQDSIGNRGVANLVFTVGCGPQPLKGLDNDGNRSSNGYSNVEVRSFDEQNGELNLMVFKNTRTVKLDEVSTELAGGDNKNTQIKKIHIDFIGAEASFDVKACNQGNLYLGFDKEENQAIINAYPDANVQFINFKQKPTFDFAGTFTYFVEDPEIPCYIYEENGGVLSKVGIYNANEQKVEVTTRTLGNYILTDKELVSQAK